MWWCLFCADNFQPCCAVFKTKQSIHPSPDELHNSLRHRRYSPPFPSPLHISRARSLLCEIRFKIPRVQRRRRRRKKKKPPLCLWKMELRADTAKGHRLKYMRHVAGSLFLGGEGASLERCAEKVSLNQGCRRPCLSFLSLSFFLSVLVHSSRRTRTKLCLYIRFYICNFSS